MSKPQNCLLGDLMEFKNGKSIKPSNGNIPIYGGNGILGYTIDFNYHDNLIIGRVGAYCGSIHIHQGKCWVSDNAIAGLPKEGYIAIYLYYLLKSLNLNNRQVGSSQPLLTQGILNNLKIQAFLGIPTQKSIAHILSTLDQKIAINNQINAQLEQMAKNLYDYWFVQFDFPDENGKPYKSSGGKMVYNDTLKREIPKGWEAQKISHWLQSDKSGDWGKEIQEGNYTLQVNCIRGADINAVNFQGNIEAPIRFILPKNKHKLLSPFNLVVEISGGSPTQSTGRLALISDYVLNRFDFPVICSNFCKAISLKNTDYFYQFVFMWNAIYKNDILFGWEGKTSGIKNLLFENFTEGYFECYPPLDLAKKFFEIADVFHKQQQFLLKQNQQLAQLRDFLLPMLMNGQVGVDGG